MKKSLEFCLVCHKSAYNFIYTGSHPFPLRLEIIAVISETKNKFSKENRGNIITETKKHLFFILHVF